MTLQYISRRLFGFLTFWLTSATSGRSDSADIETYDPTQENGKNSGLLKLANKRSEKSAAASMALQTPPTCIAHFGSAETNNPDDISIAARFQLSCRNCASSEMRILCFPLVVKEGDDFVGMEPGEVVERNPHRVECASCGERHLVFDASKHGYDGALGHGSSYSQGEGVEKPIACQKSSYRVQVMFVYNIDLDELKEIGTEENIAPQDLFDWFHIEALSEKGDLLKNINYECA